MLKFPEGHRRKEYPNRNRFTVIELHSSSKCMAKPFGPQGIFVFVFSCRYIIVLYAHAFI